MIRNGKRVTLSLSLSFQVMKNEELTLSPFYFSLLLLLILFSLVEEGENRQRVSKGGHLQQTQPY